MLLLWWEGENTGYSGTGSWQYRAHRDRGTAVQDTPGQKHSDTGHSGAVALRYRAHRDRGTEVQGTVGKGHIGTDHSGTGALRCWAQRTDPVVDASITSRQTSFPLRLHIVGSSVGGLDNSRVEKGKVCHRERERERESESEREMKTYTCACKQGQ